MPRNSTVHWSAVERHKPSEWWFSISSRTIPLYSRSSFRAWETRPSICQKPMSSFKSRRITVLGAKKHNDLVRLLSWSIENVSWFLDDDWQAAWWFSWYRKNSATQEPEETRQWVWRVLLFASLEGYEGDVLLGQASAVPHCPGL